MKRFSLAVAAVSAAGALTAGAASANDHGGWYGNLGYTYYDLEDVSPGALTGRLGYDFNPNFAVEGEVGIGIVEDEVNVLGTNVDVGIDSAFAVFGVAKAPIAENATLFGRLGYGSLEAEASAGGVSVDASVDGFAFGAGAEFGVAPGFGVRGEYTKLDGDDGDADTFSISGVFKF